jgi:hypothetical protein
VAAAGIAAHEAGHALQDAVDYFPLEARTHIVPLVQLAGALIGLPRELRDTMGQICGAQRERLLHSCLVLRSGGS